VEGVVAPRSVATGGGRQRAASIDVAWTPILVVAGVTVALLLLLANEYGFHRDELYFIVAGRHPALGYPDQPAFTPLVSAAAVSLFGLTPTAIRILPALSAGGVVVLAAMMVRELGGSTRAQALSALLTAVSGLLAAGHLDSTTTYDLLAWAVIAWLVVRLLAGADPRQWLLVGLVAGIGLENKHTVLFLGFGLAAGFLAARRWELVRGRWTWLALALAVVLWAPNLAWQAQHGFPQLDMASRISAGDNRTKLPLELMLLLGTFTFPILLAGGWWLLRDRSALSWRPLGWAVIAVLVVVVATNGKSYYAVGFLPLLAAAGAIQLDGWLARARLPIRAVVAGAVIALTGVLTGLLALPIVPLSSLGATPIPDVYHEAGAQVGWPQLVATVTGVVDTLSPGERARAVILTANYGQAGAIELLGQGLPPVVSGHNGYWDWGPPPDDRTLIVLVGEWWPSSWAPMLGRCEPRAVVDNGFGVPNDEQGTPVQVCPSMAQPWSVIWPDLRHLD
jgi:4-amino-4-deoxy-L-arabinose transferase-like glycosyltransferase